MPKAPKRACKSCWHCIPEYKNKDKAGKRTISKYWCSAMNTTCSDPKECRFRKEKNNEKV